MAKPVARTGRETPLLGAMPAWLRAAFVGTAGVRRTLVLSGFHVALIWALTTIVIWQNHQQSIDTWKKSAESISLAVAAHAAQVQGAAGLVLSSVADWIEGEDIQSEDKFRKVMS